MRPLATDFQSTSWVVWHTLSLFPYIKNGLTAIGSSEGSSPSLRLCVRSRIQRNEGQRAQEQSCCTHPGDMDCVLHVDCGVLILSDVAAAATALFDINACNVCNCDVFLIMDVFTDSWGKTHRKLSKRITNVTNWGNIEGKKPELNITVHITNCAHMFGSQSRFFLQLCLEGYFQDVILY